MLDDPYLILTLRSYGYILLSAIGFVGFILFYFLSHPNNGINKGFGLCLLAQSFLAAMVTATGLVVTGQRILTEEQVQTYLPFWQRETFAVWVLCVTIIVLGIYLLRHREKSSKTDS